MSELQTLEQGWDHAAHTDPFFNILTIHGLTEEQFWEMGRTEIDGIIPQLDGLQHVRGLDFGCGVGRLTRALAEHFVEVDGVDVSGKMIELARQHNQHEAIRFHHNPHPDLALFADDQFDLVYSSIVLQHMPSDMAGGYVSEFLRVTRPDGMIVFQIPEGFDVARHGSDWLSMYGTPRETVEQWIVGHELVDVEANQASGAGFSSHRYVVRV